MGNFFDAQGQVTLKSVIWFGWNSNLSKILCLLVTSKFGKDMIKNEGDSAETWFLPLCQWGAFCCHGNHSFDGICSKTYRQPFPHPTGDTYKIWSRLANWYWRFHNKSIENLISTQQHITLKWLIQSGLNSNSTEILCLTWLPASLTKIW